MMKAVALWSVPNGNTDSFKARPCDKVQQTETENQLEQLLVNSPDLLEDGLRLVARQSATEGGPLDLLGVDRDGRFVVFELKRGSLSRDAVSQVIDYVSYLERLTPEDREHHVEENSGKGGLKEIENFRDWYQEEFAGDAKGIELPPRAVLVGLGADDRTRRMVEFLAGQGVDIELLTFHAFSYGDDLLLARQTEVQSKGTSHSVRTYGKAENQRILTELAKRFECSTLLTEVQDTLTEALGGYVWPNATCFSVTLPEKTDSGNLSYRNIVSVYVDQQSKGSIRLSWNPRAWTTPEFGGRSAVHGLHLPAETNQYVYVTLSRADWDCQKADWVETARLLREKTAKNAEQVAIAS